MSHHLEQSNGIMGHASVTDERIASSSVFRKSLVSLPADSDRRRDGGSELFMVKASPVTGLTTEDVVEQMRICGSTTAAAAAAASSSSSSSSSASASVTATTATTTLITTTPTTDQQHKDDQETTLAMTVSPVSSSIAPIALREANATSASKRSIDSETAVSSISSNSHTTPMEPAVLTYDAGSGSSEAIRDVGGPTAAVHSDEWQLPSPVWKRARVRSDDDRPEDPTSDLAGQDATVPSIVQPSTPEETLRPPTHAESSVTPLALVTAPANDTQAEVRTDNMASPEDATTPVTTYPPLALPSPTSDAHSRMRTFSPPSLLEAFTSSEPVLSPIQSYFGSDPYSPSNFSFPRHDHYLGSILTDDHTTQSGDSRMPIDDYHGFATHPWSEQSTPSHVLSHRWTRRVASSDGVPVVGSTVEHQGGFLPQHHHHNRHSHHHHHHQNQTGRYDRATTRRSRHFAPAMVDRPWHELRSALPFASLSTATVTARANASTMTVDGDDGGVSDSGSDDLYDVDRDLMMAQEHLSSRGVADVDEGSTDDRLEEAEDGEGDEDDGLDGVLRAIGRDRTVLRRIRRLHRSQTYEDEDEEREGEGDEDVEDGEDDDEEDDDDDDMLGRRDELIGLEIDDDDELEIGSYDGYGEYEMAYGNSFDHNHNLRYSDDEEDLEDDEDFGYGYRLSELSRSSSSISRTPDQRLSSSHGFGSSLPFWRQTDRHSPSIHSNASLPSPTQPRPLRRYVLRGSLEGLDPGLELRDLEDDLDPMDGSEDHEIEVDDDTESLHPLDEDEEDELALMLGYENRHQSRRQASTLSEWRSSTWRMPRIGTVHHPGQSTTALSSDQYEARDGSQASEESDEMMARRLQSEEYVEALRRRLDHDGGNVTIILRANSQRATTERTYNDHIHSDDVDTSAALESIAMAYQQHAVTVAGPHAGRSATFGLHCATATVSCRRRIWGNPADYLEDDQVDDSYEGLLRLSEQIGDAKSRGVPTKVLRMLDRFLFSWHSLHDGQDHPSMLASRGSRMEHQLHGAVAAAAAGGSGGGNLSLKLLYGAHPNSGAAAAGSSSSSSSLAPPHPLVVRKVRSVSQLKSSAGTGNTPLSATASTSGALGNANTSAAAAGGGGGHGALAASPSMVSSGGSGSGTSDPHARQLRRMTRRISQDCLRERMSHHPLHLHFQQQQQQKQQQQKVPWSKEEEEDKRKDKRDSLDLPGLADSCSICLQTYEAKDWLRPLPCRHAFHMGCIDTWLSNNCQCPICRQEVSQAKIESMLRGAMRGTSGGGEASSSTTTAM
ncbi:E3 ubiquitin-protein ligase rnf6 [Actinomortierella ambigua]|uniref:E3 ubiquitin-protein ligase rnf6 n=1 Tax=Actinomortierella ambigua TaxID=1343610 RepID=A0A9P6PQF0_9FUNG|nr:E3 ubiquitin-protein ligase rnf6 [Actinomortierella ambigua]